MLSLYRKGKAVDLHRDRRPQHRRHPQRDVLLGQPNQLPACLAQGLAHGAGDRAQRRAQAQASGAPSACRPGGTRTRKCIVTLILGMSKPEGIYLCVDYRVTDSRTGGVLDDAAPKILQVTFPPLDGGPKALLGYTGVAILPDGTRTGDWIRETLRGESEVINAAMAHLKSRLNRDIARLRGALIINILVLEPNARFFGAFSNVRKTAFGVVVQPHFDYVMQPLTAPFLFGNGSGAYRLDAATYRKLESQLDVRPRKAFDHMKLLATANRQVAAKEKTVSPYCHVSFINADDRMEPQAHVFTKQGETVPFSMPILLGGIDLSSLVTQMFPGLTDPTVPKMQPGAMDDADEINRQLRRRP